MAASPFVLCYPTCLFRINSNWLLILCWPCPSSRTCLFLFLVMRSVVVVSVLSFCQLIQFYLLLDAPKFPSIPFAIAISASRNKRGKNFFFVSRDCCSFCVCVYSSGRESRNRYCADDTGPIQRRPGLSSKSLLLQRARRNCSFSFGPCHSG